MARYLRNGTLDQAFGSGGTVTTPSISGSAKGSAVAIQPDGKIIVVGASSGFALARYHANGSLDSSFGTGGTITIALGNDGFFGGANGIVLQADGKIVVAGTDHLNFALARFTREGALDHTFGQDGTIITDLGSNDWCNGVVIQTDGKIVAAGDTENGWDFALARYNPNGTLDPTFGTGGISITDLGSQARGRDAEIQPDGKILVAGAVWEGAFALAQYRLDGTLDETFGTGGIVVTDFSEIPGMGMSVALQTNGKIVMVGYAADTITLARYEGRDVPTTYLPMIMQASEHYAVPGE